jgi:hypothetical protein
LPENGETGYQNEADPVPETAAAQETEGEGT